MIVDPPHGNMTAQQMQTAREQYDAIVHAVVPPPFKYHRDWDYGMVACNTVLDETQVVLDVGCACSFIVVYLAHFVNKVWGIDNDTFACCKMWRDSLAEYDEFRSGKIEIIWQDASILPFQDSFFDKVFTFSALEHFDGDSDIKCAREVARVLKPGGEFIGTVDYHPTVEYKEGRDRTYTLPSFMRRIVEPGGFRPRGEVSVDSPEVAGDAFGALFFALVK